MELFILVPFKMNNGEKYRATPEVFDRATIPSTSPGIRLMEPSNLFGSALHEAQGLYYNFPPYYPYGYRYDGTLSYIISFRNTSCLSSIDAYCNATFSFKSYGTYQRSAVQLLWTTEKSIYGVCHVSRRVCP